MNEDRERLTLNISKKLIQEMKMQAIREDKSLYALAEEIFELYLSLVAEENNADKKKESMSKVIHNKEKAAK